MATPPPILETARLRLRPLRLEDAPALNAIQSDPAHMRFYPHPFSMQETVAWIERMRDRYRLDGLALLGVEDRATGAFLGNVGPLLQHVDGIDEIELGWSISPARARQGIATEAAGACRDWVFDAIGPAYVISLILRKSSIPDRRNRLPVPSSDFCRYPSRRFRSFRARRS